MDLKQKVRVIEDFPQEGISFKDITTLLKDGEAFDMQLNLWQNYIIKMLICQVDQSGFIVKYNLAYELGVGFVIGAEKR